MNNFYYSFHFKPTQLTEVAQKLQKKYRETGHLPEHVVRRDLPMLLKEIQSLSNHEEVLKEFADHLKNIHLKILSSEYPYNHDDEALLDKIRFMLEYRYNSYIGKRFWNHFQQRPDDQFVQSILSKAFETENSSFLGLLNRIRVQYNDIFNGSHIIEEIALGIGNENDKVNDSFKDWKITTESGLSNKIWHFLIQNFINDSSFIERQDKGTLLKVLNHYPTQDYKQAMDLYLNSFELDDLHDFIMSLVLQRLGNPTESTLKWYRMTEESINKAKQWVYQQQLKEFLDNERFQYWKKYLHLTHDVKTINEPPISAMYFGDFVVVEFANKGNAAYFYKTEGFERTLSRNLKTGTKVEYLKNQYADFYINKLNHSGGWNYRFDTYMNQYLRGQYYYTHY
ncbi:EH signature domain-containing protein [Piscibacillus halophilus]|uniref:EH signature domain-containing protein n=1 Tax=Piscibacillus halophilus TaxID=571933 RepID=UPI00158E1EE4|nr:EH signature domain-containing protein [Piscibacillus halophilus]